MSSRTDIARFWDATVADFFAGRTPHQEDDDLRRWFAAYAGSGRGVVTEAAFPEPYIGPLDPAHGQPRLVALGLNPGEADLEYQGRNGVFQRELERAGSYSAWSVTEPYLRDPWRSAHRHNRYHANLRTFAQRWTDDPSVRSRDVLVFELYPWHSNAVTATMHPDPALIDRYVWQPLAEVDLPVVFAFGRDWTATARGLGLTEQPVDATFNASDRQLRVFDLPSGQRLAVVWQSGYAGPPGANDIPALRAMRPRSVRPKRADEATRCVHDMLTGTCGICASSATASRRAVVDDRSTTGTLLKHMHAVAETATPKLRQLGFGGLRVQRSAGFLPLRWPAGLWYRVHTQNDDAHVAITAAYVQFRVHIDSFHGDRARNNAALDILRLHLEPDLLARLPDHDALDWRAARGGNNQVCAVTQRRSLGAQTVEEDASWIVDAANAWLRALQTHQITSLRQLTGEG
jgi:hypothetical protein